MTNPTGATKDVTVSITANTAAGFPKFLEAADLDAGALTCVTGSGTAYYKGATTTATFTCTGTLPANAASVITISSGSLIATSAVGQTVTIAANVTPGGANRTLQGTFVAGGTTAPPTTTVAPTTTTVAATTTTTAATTTTTTAAPSATSTAGSTTTTTIAPTTTTTTAAPTGPVVSGSLANLKSGTTYAIPTPDNPDRGFVGLLTVSNPTATTKVVTVTIDASTPAGFPKYFEAGDYAAGSFACVTGTNGAYYKASTAAATFTCTGTLAANAASVITVSSGSMIAPTAVGQPVTIVATANPGASTKTLQGNFA